MYTFDEKFKKGAARAFKAQQGLTAFLSGLNRILPEPPGFKTEKTKDEREDTIRIADTAGDSWYLGFSERSITPPDIDAKNYYIGGNLSAPPRRVRGVLDDIKVRAIAISDGEERAAEVFCAVDCIGLTNTVVRRIRSELDSFCRTNNVGYINIFSTHAHSSIDTMGIWSVTGKKFFENISRLITHSQPLPSVDGAFIDLIVEKTKKAVAEAVRNMEPGRLFAAQIGENSVEKLEKYSAKKPYGDMTLSEYGIKDFIFAKRPPREYSPRLNRLRFVPDNIASRPTVLVNFGAHPYANGLRIKNNRGDMLSADFPFYMEREITPGLVSGTGDMLAENSITNRASGFKSLCDIVGGDTAVFGLANDALGYIIPDNDYCMFFAGYGKLAEKLFFKDYAHYQEIFSIGAHTASAFAAGVEDMMKSFKARLNK